MTMRTGRRLLVFVALCAVAAGGRAVVPPYESAAPVPGATDPIDQAVLAALRSRRIEPAPLCSDAVFCRRVHLDLLGRLPEPEVVVRFLDDESPTKRTTLVDALLARPELADYWAMRWCDILRVKSEFPINLWPNAAQAYHRWVLDAVRQNLPYDRFARALLTSSGSNFRVPPVNFYRAVQSREPAALAQAAALTFMGTRTERWTEPRRAELAAFFSRVTYKRTKEWKEEIVLSSPQTALGPLDAVLPDGTEVRIAAGDDPRQAFADWLLAPGNPWFARCAANRIWAWVFGRGIVEEPDDLRPDNPPSNPKLLALLEQGFVRSGYDVRRLLRRIVLTETYQRSSIPGSDHVDAASLFAHYPVRRLGAEVLVDALCQITGTSEDYMSAIPEPFTFIPPEERTVALADGSITSPVLEMFGRPARDTGLMAERSLQPSPMQRLHLLNSTDILRRIRQMFATGRIDVRGRGRRQGRGRSRGQGQDRGQGRARGRRQGGAARRQGRGRGEVIEQVYLRVLSRRPTDAELGAVLQYVREAGVRPGEAAQDLVWALLNTKEFLYRH